MAKTTANEPQQSSFFRARRVADLYVFAVLVREGSRAGAAKALGTSQSVISESLFRLLRDIREIKKMKTLELVVNRGENECALTSLGQVIYSHSINIYESVRQIETFLNEFDVYETERFYTFAHTPLYSGSFLRQLIENITMMSEGAVPQSSLVNEGAGLKTTFLNGKSVHAHLTSGTLDFFLGREVGDAGDVENIELGTDHWKILFHHSYANELFRNPNPEPGPIEQRPDINRSALLRLPYLLVNDTQLEEELRSNAPFLRICGRYSDYNSLLHQLLTPRFYVAIVPSLIAKNALIQYPGEFSYANIPSSLRLRPYRMVAYLSEKIKRTQTADYIIAMLTSVSEIL